MKTFLRDINDGWKTQIVTVVERGGDNSLKTDATEKHVAPQRTDRAKYRRTGTNPSISRPLGI